MTALLWGEGAVLLVGQAEESALFLLLAALEVVETIFVPGSDLLRRFRLDAIARSHL